VDRLAAILMCRGETVVLRWTGRATLSSFEDGGCRAAGDLPCGVVHLEVVDAGRARTASRCGGLITTA
jgi:hypothetical protein